MVRRSSATFRVTSHWYLFLLPRLRGFRLAIRKFFELKSFYQSTLKTNAINWDIVFDVVNPFPSKGFPFDE